MPKYIPKTLKRLNYASKKFPQHSPHPFTPIAYSKKGTQQISNNPHQKELSKDQIRHV